MFLDALEKILAVHGTGAAVRRIEAGDAPAALWQPLEEAGFLDLMTPEAQGGAGLPLQELFPLLECLGRHALPLPLAQAIVARAVAGPQTRLPDGVLTIATQMQRPDTGGLRCPQTPGGAVADHVLVADGDSLLLLSCAAATRVPVGDPRNLVAHLWWPQTTPAERLPAGGQLLEAFAVAAVAAQLGGAMQRAFDMALDQCNNRVQFGKSIGKFQALQQQLSVMAEHVLAACIAAESAFRSERGTPTLLGAAIAKARTGEAASLVAATAHAVHGAIGMTDEFELGIVTRRLHDWRMAYGAEQHWNRIIGAQVLASQDALADFVRAV